ncbi:hypothetical protein PC117_g5645 [Phytophthora cactorum]|uniref:Uncharacterized protein n=1 Tax=Phytophthora cactorum TaxID=29920 RepID=A0A8T1ECD7_9STRA|nr:hypothetical protein PC117_g5645 [Phytophthora cactorum]
MGRSEHVTAAADPASPSHSGRSDATAESATPLIPDDNDVLLPQHLNTEDVNVMKDSENADDYESIGSEADGSGSSDDDRIKRRQIGDEESSGNKLRSMAWSPASSEFEPDVHTFPGMSDQVARPKADIRAKKDSLVELLFYFMPTYLW